MVRSRTSEFVTREAPVIEVDERQRSALVAISAEVEDEYGSIIVQRGLRMHAMSVGAEASPIADVVRGRGDHAGDDERDAAEQDLLARLDAHVETTTRAKSSSNRRASSADSSPVSASTLPCIQASNLPGPQARRRS